MVDALNMLYRLFAPLLVVILIIVGVDLSSGLIKNSQEGQTATVAQSSGTSKDAGDKKSSNQFKGIDEIGGKCKMGTVPVEPKTCPKKNIWGVCVPKQPCKAIVEGQVVSGFFKPEDCCLATQWAGVPGAGKFDLMKMLEEMMLKLGGGGGGGGGGGAKPEENKLPVCRNAVATPTLPIDPGESALLTWAIDGGSAYTVSVSPGVGIVKGNSVSVSPNYSTTYTITARNNAGSVSCPRVRVYVGPGAYDNSTFEQDNDSDSDVEMISTEDNDNSQVSNDNSEYTEVVAEGSEDMYDNLPDGVEVTSVDNTEGDDEAGATNNNSDLYYGAGIRDDNQQYNNEDYEGTGIEYITNNNTGDSAYIDNLQESSGLTTEELYGIWSRPQSPTSGGFSSTGGYRGGGGDGTIIIENQVLEEGTVSKILKWFKKTFCLWCESSAYINPSNQVGQVSSTIKQSQIPEGGFEGLRNMLNNTRTTQAQPAQALNIQSFDWTFKWERWNRGRVVEDKDLTVQVVDVMDKNKRELKRKNKEVKFNSVKTDGKEDPTKGVPSLKFTFYKKGNIYKPWIKVQADRVYPIKYYNDRSIYNSSEISIRCDSEHLTMIAPGSGMNLYNKVLQKTKLKMQWSETSPQRLSVVLKEGEKTDSQVKFFGYSFYCGNLEKSSSERIEDITKDYKVQIDEIEEKTGPGAEPYTTKQREQWSWDDSESGFEEFRRPDFGNKEGNRKGSIDKKQGNKQPTNTPSPVPTYEDTGIDTWTNTPPAETYPDTNNRPDNRPTYQDRSPQQPIYQQQQRQQKPQKKQKTWLDSLMEMLTGKSSDKDNIDKEGKDERLPEFPDIVAKHQCIAFDANKTEIESGEEVVLQWVVKGASKIVIIPKVEIVEVANIEGVKKTIAIAKPESSVKYTLVATNPKGEEHTCQSKEIVVRDAEPIISCESASITIAPDSVARPACDPEIGGDECDNAWDGELVKISWEATPRECLSTCKISNQDGDIWTNTEDLEKGENEGMLRETSTFKIMCDDGLGNGAEAEAEATVEQE